ncbi:PREDICTED: uncharacterized protein LOC109152995 [Ipomoea nil]|uniref:uncharacterized protein LOC109152995 n=1 Tax=Ipomoea nil TaxID=35883 RepID=UPI000900CB47|nr:PREDICTED: uncharacterized protein LOC109152995 [Ipomoea nil]
MWGTIADLISPYSPVTKQTAPEDMKHDKHCSFHELSRAKMKLLNTARIRTFVPQILWFNFMMVAMMIRTATATPSLPAKHQAVAAMHGGRPVCSCDHTNSEMVWKHVRHGGVMDAPAASSSYGGGERAAQKLTKLLLNVSIQNSLGPLRVVLSPENTVGDLIKAAVEMYVKEKRRPLLPATHPSHYELHYSQFSLQSLREEEKLIKLESRNFFLCPKLNGVANTTCSIGTRGASATKKSLFPLTKFMDFLL